MRLQLKWLVALAAAGGISGATALHAHADGSVTLRGAYYKERATRVMQPMLDGNFGVSEHGEVEAHLLVDAITSASAATGAEDAFSEKRYEAGVGYTHTRGKLVLGGNVRGSTEPDYRSLFVLGHGQLALAQDNFVLGFAVGGGRDNVTNAGALLAPPISENLTTALASVSASQLLSPTALVALTYDVALLRGYQQNPYRVVQAEAGSAAERHPNERMRHALAASGRWYRDSTATTLIASYRLYVDDWGVVGHTPELRVVQAAGESVDFTARYRFHRQNAADFYKAHYTVNTPELEPYLSADDKLSAFTSHTLEAKLGIRGEAFGATAGSRWADMRLELLLQYVIQGTRFGNAVAGQVALTVPLSQ